MWPIKTTMASANQNNNGPFCLTQSILPGVHSPCILTNFAQTLGFWHGAQCANPPCPSQSILPEPTRSSRVRQNQSSLPSPIHLVRRPEPTHEPHHKLGPNQNRIPNSEPPLMRNRHITIVSLLSNPETRLASWPLVVSHFMMPPLEAIQILLLLLLCCCCCAALLLLSTLVPPQLNAET